MKMTTLRVNEIFYSIQGEGGNSGRAAIFIRLSGCNMSCSFCDTDFRAYSKLSIADLKKEIKKYPCDFIIWTGGEPTLQLTDKILKEFSGRYIHAIETNGTRPIPSLINYVSYSPKGEISKSIVMVDEVRLPVQKGAPIPELSELPLAKNYYLSPVDVLPENIDYCLNYIRNNPQWRLSIQIHKLLNFQ
jgi:organic radical activating enzyme